MSVPPPPWVELLSTESLNRAFALLHGTFPSRYLSHDPDSLRQKMNFPRDVPSIVNPGQQVSVASLRIFTWPNKTAPQIAAFFFLRYLCTPRAYCLSVGIDTPISSGVTLHDELVTIGRYMQNEDGVRTIDVVNPRVIGPKAANPQADDLPDTPRSKIVFDAFMHATGAGQTLSSNPGDIAPGWPWPSKLKRWQAN